MTNSVSPLVIKPRLATTPQNPPHYAVKVQLQNGDTAQVADPRATRAMVALMDMNAMHGGAASHYGGPAAFAELMAATHALMFQQARSQKREWFDAFNFVNDAGHCENGLYALKANYGFANLKLSDLKKFRSIESPLTGHGEAHLFPQGVLVSNGPLGSGLPQAQGLAMADSLADRKRITIAALSDGGAMEGEAKEALAAIPGLARKGKMAPFVCIISDNKTKLSGRIEQDSFSMEPTFQSLEKLGWKVMRLSDGHNLQACIATLEEAFTQVRTDPSVPVVIHARTIKGKGSKKAEISSTGAHGFPLKKAEELPAFLSEIYEGQTVPTEFIKWAEECSQWEKNKTEKASAGASFKIGEGPNEKIQLGISSALTRKRKDGLPIISVSSDLQGSTGLAEFQKEFPEATLDVGIAEANMISTAAGLSLGGYIPVVDTFAQFGVTKGALPITMSNLSLAPVIAVFSHTGFQDAADGASHQALSFFAQVSSIPHTEVYALSCSSEADELLAQSVERYASERKAGRIPPSTIFFLGRENFARRFSPESVPYKLGQAQVVLDTVKESARAVTIVAAGSMLSEALKAAHELGNEGWGTIVINASCINHPDTETIAMALKRTGGHLVTVEEHRVVGGMSAMLTHALLVRGERFDLRALAIGDHFGQSSYTALELYKKHGLDSVAIVKASRSFF